MANQAWDQFKARFVRADGRVIDIENGSISHSEGQGVGMLLSVANGDRRTFDSLWHWTQKTLQRSDLPLFSWKYDVRATPHVPDLNDAADGDILIAWALLRAGKTWQDQSYRDASKAIRQAVAEKLTYICAGRMLLLPALNGFTHQDGSVTVNLSYWIMPAFKEFAPLDGPAAPWHRLITDGENLILDARFGRYGLNPDWLVINTKGYLSVNLDRPPRFGYEAVRIPLYLAWAGEDVANLAGTTLSFWSKLTAAGKALPAWVDLRNGVMSNYAAQMGNTFIYLLALGTASSALDNAVLSKKDSYYSAILSLMAQRASIERRAQ